MARKKKSWQKRLITAKYFLNLILAFVLIIFGAGLIFWVTYQHIWESGPQKISQSQAVEQRIKANSKPTKIYIPKLQRTLDISDGYVENNRWKVATTGVSYLTTSGTIGKVGNAVIYGHNTTNILGGLWMVQTGDFVEVTDNNGKVYKYEIFERKEIKPSEVEILNQTNDARLTIYTCSGFLDSARFVIVGRYVPDPHGSIKT